MIHAIIIPAAIKDSCNQVAVQLGIDPEGTLSTLCVPLVPVDGPDDAEPTHYGACGQMSEIAREYLAANLNRFPGAAWWRWNHAGILMASHNSLDFASVWNWDNCYKKLNLKPRVINI